MNFGLTKSEYLFLIENVIKPLKDRSAQIYLFGSRATGEFSKFSDVDILFVPHANQPIEKHFLYEIKEKLETSRFPYKVDLVNIHELASSYKAQVLKEIIEL